MDGFRVDTIGLAESGMKYREIGARLSDDAMHMRGIMSELSGQTIGCNVSELLRGAIRAVEASAERSRDLCGQCTEAADVYERTERQVTSVVAALPSESPFMAAASSAGGSERVLSAYRPAKPVLFSGNRLPSESWLLSRAITASMEGES